MRLDSEEQIDPSLWRPADQPILTPERLAKPDTQIEAPCPECQSLPDPEKRACKNCRGRGRVLIRDKSSVPLDEIRYAQAILATVINDLQHRASSTTRTPTTATPTKSGRTSFVRGSANFIGEAAKGNQEAIEAFDALGLDGWPDDGFLDRLRQIAAELKLSVTRDDEPA